VLHGLGDAVAAVDGGEVALALREREDLLVAGGEEAPRAGADSRLELRDGEDCGSEGLVGEDCVARARARVRRGGNEGN
jgi:hypothetical protein